MKTKVVIPYDPVSKPSTQFGLARNGRVRTWNKSATKRREFQRWLTHHLTQEQKDSLCLEPDREIHVSIYFGMPIPPSSSEQTKRLMEWGLIPHTSKPDNDNLSKFASDVGNEMLWNDDRQLVVMNLRKEYDVRPRVEYTIELKEPRMNAITKIVFGHMSLTRIKELTIWFKLLDQERSDMYRYEEMDDEEKKAFLDRISRILGYLSENHGEVLGIVAKKLAKEKQERKEDVDA